MEKNIKNILQPLINTLIEGNYIKDLDMKILIYGFGRMGLTHFSILNGLNSNINFSIIEPNKLLRIILKKNIDAHFYADDSILKDPFDITLITTPPFVHLQLVQNSIKRKDRVIFVEKPFGGCLNTKLDDIAKLNSVYIGYVLLFNPCVQWISVEQSFYPVTTVRR